MLNKPDLDVWDSCCIFGVLNNEKDKVASLLAQMPRFESGESILGIPSAAISEIVRLADGSPAQEPLKQFLASSYIQTLIPTPEVAILSGQLQYRFDYRQIPELKTKAMSFGCGADQALRLRSKDADILATAIYYKASRLTTYDPFLRFLGQEYLTNECGLIVDVPSTSYLPMTFLPQK
jgi:predicted nucleic acid-binding protein